MGTNIYAYRNHPEFQHKITKLQESYDKQDYDEVAHLADQIKDLINQSRVHIGKYSHGRKFQFDHNNFEYYTPFRDSIDEFLKSCVKIVDDPGNYYTPEEFWKEYVDDNVDGKSGEQFYLAEINMAKRKEAGLEPDPYDVIMTVPQAEKAYERAKNMGFYEWHEYKGVSLDNLPYVFMLYSDFQ